jgi:hypothetical protein
VPKLADFLTYWLKDIVEPNLAPKTYERYEMFTRLHIIPHPSAALREKTKRGRNTSGAAAPSDNAARENCRHAATKTPATHSAPR